MISKMEFRATVLILCLYKYISSQFCIFLIVACMSLGSDQLFKNITLYGKIHLYTSSFEV